MIFPKKMFLMLQFINCPNFIVFTSWDIGQHVHYNYLLSSCDVIKSEINLIFLIKPFWYMTKKSKQKLKYLESEKSFWGEIKSYFHHFQRVFSCQKLSQTLVCAFNFLGVNVLVPMVMISNFLSNFSNFAL